MNEWQGLTATVVVALAAMIAVAVAATLLAPLIPGAIMTRADLLGAPCAQLPPTGEVRRIVAERQEVWTQVRQRSVTASVDTGAVPAKPTLSSTMRRPMTAPRSSGCSATPSSGFPTG